MTYTELVVLIPSHSLEDLPTELPDPASASLLNAFAVVWHPVLLHQTQTLPRWSRSDEPPGSLEHRLIVIPTASDDWLPGGWAGYAEKQGAVVVSGLESREDMLKQALAPLEEAPAVDPEIVGDFLALGTCHLLLELLTRRMHYYSNLDEVQLERETLKAATAAVQGDLDTARSHLKTAFECLLEARERFYPVDCYLVDLCLVIPRIALEQREPLLKMLNAEKPVNLLATAKDYQDIQDKSPEITSAIRAAWETGQVNLLGGEWEDAPLPLLPINAVLWQFAEGQRAYQRLFGRVPRCWGRKRYGLSTQLPQVLTKWGYHSALHIVMDDGLYPDEDECKLRWEGADKTLLDALGRFPLTAEGAANYLKFPQHMAESMERDQVAAVVFARWPEVKAPWFEDLARMQRYAPVLGRFVTLDDLMQNTNDPGRLSAFDQKEYLPPFFIQSAARQEQNPISRWSNYAERRRRLESAQWAMAMADILGGQSVDQIRQDAIEQTVESAGPDCEESQERAEAISQAEAGLETFEADAWKNLAKVLLSGAGMTRGFLLLNPLSHTRIAAVELPELQSPPPLGNGIKAVHFGESRRAVVAEIAGHGFLWLPQDGHGMMPAAKKGDPLLAEDWSLRNDFFEVHINEATGGIARIKNYGRTPNRLSQQLAYRFPHEREIPVGEPGEDGERELVKSFYSEMRCRSMQVTSSGPTLGEIITEGDIIDQKDGSLLATYKQTTRVWRHRPVVEVELELDLQKLPDADPWTNYYALRFAWNDSTAALTRSVQDFAFGFRGERFDSPDYLEIAEGDQRTTILFHGLPFHRKTGPRMLDTLLITAGETKRRFRFDVAIDQSYPLVAAREATTPVIVIPTQDGPPKSGALGWFLHINAKNVQILSLKGTHPKPDSPPDEPFGFVVRLAETEGRARDVKLRSFRTPTKASVQDFQGQTLATLTIESDAVHIPMHAYEMIDVELAFGVANKPENA